MKQRSWNYQEAEEHFLCQSRMLQSRQLQGNKRMKQRSWNYEERLRPFPLSGKNTTIFSASRKQKSGTKQLDILRMLENISAVGQEYYNLFNFKEA